MEGREFVAGSVHGEPGQSFKFNVDKGIGGDFATGERFGDLIDVYAAIKGIGVGEAAKELALIEGLTSEKRAPTPVYSLVAPPDGEEPPARGELWTYRDLSGAALFHVERYEIDGKKAFRPWSWNSGNGGHLTGWVNKMWPDPRPLYGLDTLVVGKPVLLVEGEKACLAARAFAGRVYSCLTWPGGANAVSKADWTALTGHDVLIWPDADGAGMKACGQIVEKLRELCPSIKVLNVDDMPEGFDAADSGFDWEMFKAWAKPRARVVWTAPELPPMPEVSDDPGRCCENGYFGDGHECMKQPGAEAKVPATRQIPLPDNLIELLPHWKHTKTSSIPLATIENVRALLDAMGVIVRYNVISKQEEVLIPAHGSSIDNEANSALAWIMSLQVQIGMSTANVKDYLTHIADQNPYNPVATWVLSKPWDGKSRLQDLYSTIVAKGEDNPAVMSLKKTLIRRWLVSAIAGAFSPRGVSAHGVLVLQGDQYIGKTAWVKSLAPRDLGIVADGKILKPDDKDSVAQIVRHWIVELGELDATFRKADIAQLKAFITKDVDVFRRAYAARESMYARRTVFFASVNQAEFLHDETGNRRFWTIECQSIKYDHDVDMQQVWAEVHQLWVDGEQWVLTYDEMTQLNQHNESFMAKDPVEEMVETLLAWDSNEHSWVYKTTTDVLIGVGMKNPNQAQKKKATQEIKKRNGGRQKKIRGHNYFFVPRNRIRLAEPDEFPSPSPQHPSPRNPWDAL